MDQRIKFIRYVDDFVIFAKSESDAYVSLSLLAQALFDRRNLKLNEQKTKILSIESYQEQYLSTPDEIENNQILTSFSSLLEELGIDDNPYEEIDPAEIAQEDWDRLRSVNLNQLLRQELEKPEPQGYLVTFILANLAKLDDTSLIDLILEDDTIRKLFPKLRSIINYLERVGSFSEEKKEHVGARILDLMERSFVSTLEFNRMWFMHLFSRSSEWDNIHKFEHIWKSFSDNSTRREILLARGRAHDIEFFRRMKGENLDTNNWIRRAFLAAVSCLPKPERKPWYKARSLRSRDILDKVVEKWAQENPF